MIIMSLRGTAWVDKKKWKSQLQVVGVEGSIDRSVGGVRRSRVRDVVRWRTLALSVIRVVKVDGETTMTATSWNKDRNRSGRLEARGCTAGGDRWWRLLESLTNWLAGADAGPGGSVRSVPACQGEALIIRFVPPCGKASTGTRFRRVRET